MIYLELFWSFAQIGLFSIGGGYAAMPLIQHQVVEIHPWLTLTEFADIVTIAEMTPGPIAINSATFVGTRVAGFPGAVVATLGCVLPSCVIVMTLAWVYYRFRGLSMIQGVLLGLRPAVVAMIASAGLSILGLAFFGGAALPASLEGVDFIAVLIFAVALAVLRLRRPGPIMVMAGAGAAGLLLYWFL
jgi:chromate transporter